MPKKIITILFLSVCLSQAGISQQEKNMQEINVVWEKFSRAFETLDYQLFADIHSEKLIRVPNGRRIVAYNNYIESYKNNFEKNKNENIASSIYLRFFERTNNDSVASERGIYKFIRNEGTPNEKTSYGKFHVLLIKESGVWKILMDYDNSEGGTINEEDFNNAYEMDDFDKFVKD